MHKVHPLAWQAEPTDYANTHCMKCAAGWTRRGTDGITVILCLLDREPVFATMTDCDRFLSKEEAEDPHQLNLMPRQKAR